jgi:hypothetical protein
MKHMFLEYHNPAILIENQALIDVIYQFYKELTAIASDPLGQLDI